MLQGEIHILPLADLIQWLAFNQRTGALKVMQQQYGIEIFFIKGEIAAASASDQPVIDSPERVIEVFNALAAWRVGRFAFLEGTLPLWVSVGNLHLSAETLLHNAIVRPAQLAAAATGYDEVAVIDHGSGLPQRIETLRLKIIDQIMWEDFNLPAMPQLAARVLELTQDPNYSVRDLGNAILADQAVAVRVLRYANSARHSAEREIVSLAVALQRLGTDEVVNIVLAASLQARRLGKDSFAEERKRLWLHSSIAAFIARALAGQLGLERNVAFLCGLLMDFGMNVLYSVIQDILNQQTRAELFPKQMIQQVIQDFHPAVGHMVGEKWELPATVVQAMAYHHCVEEMNTGNPFIAVTALADYLTDFVLGVPQAVLDQAILTFTPVQLSMHPAAQSLGLDAVAAASILTNLPVNVYQARELVAN